MKQRHGWLQRILLCIIIASALPVLADEVVFPDSALNEVILAALGMDTGPIDSEYLEQLTTLLAGSKGIVDLTGLDACVGLEQLHLYYNRIVDLGPLAGLQMLKSLSLNGNRIIDVSPIASLYNLISLAVHSNQITDVHPIASLPLLTSLSIGNAIEDIAPLASLPSLTRLMVYVLPTTDLSPLHQMHNLDFLLVSSGQATSGRVPFDSTLLVSSTKLTTLRLEGYDIAHIADLGDIVPSLSELELHYVGIDDLSMLRTFDGLVSLTLNGVIPSSEGAEISQLRIPSTLKTLVLENNGLDNLTLIADFTSLTNLSLARNRITDIAALESLANLQVLDLSFNQITDLGPLRALLALKSLTLQGVPFDRTEGSDTNILIKELRDRGVNVYY